MPPLLLVKLQRLRAPPSGRSSSTDSRFRILVQSAGVGLPELYGEFSQASVLVRSIQRSNAAVGR